MYQIAVAIAEEEQPVPLCFVWLAGKGDSLRLQLFVCAVEIRNGDSDVAQAGRSHSGMSSAAFRRNNFDEAAIRGFDEVVASVLESDFEFEIGDVPIGQALGIGRCDSEVFDASEHLTGIVASN